MNEEKLTRIIGHADMCELLARLFAFPDAELASALRDGSVFSDLRNCLLDAGYESEVEKLSVANQVSVDLPILRREYTRLYMKPGRPEIFPYESAFLHCQMGREGAPALFKTSVTLDVESQMKASGVVPDNVRREPCDSIWEEFTFLSYLYGKMAASLYEGCSKGFDVWQERLQRFATEHACCWIPSFLESTALKSQSFYAEIANIALPFAKGITAW